MYMTIVIDTQPVLAGGSVFAWQQLGTSGRARRRPASSSVAKGKMPLATFWGAGILQSCNICSLKKFQGPLSLQVGVAACEL